MGGRPLHCVRRAVTPASKLPVCVASQAIIHPRTLRERNIQDDNPHMSRVRSSIPTPPSQNGQGAALACQNGGASHCRTRRLALSSHHSHNRTAISRPPSQGGNPRRGLTAVPSPSPELPGFQAVHGTTLRYSGIRQPSGYGSGRLTQGPRLAAPPLSKQSNKQGTVSHPRDSGSLCCDACPSKQTSDAWTPLALCQPTGISGEPRDPIGPDSCILP